MLLARDFCLTLLNRSLTVNGAADKVGIGNQLLQLADDLVGALGVDVLVVVAGEEGSSVLGPEVFLDLLNGGSNLGVLDANSGNDVQPRDNSPQTILLTDVVTTSAKALLSADGQLLGIKECTEELPASRDLVAVQALGLGNEVNSTAGGHRASKAVDAVLLEVGDKLSVVSDDGKRIAGGDEGISTVDHIAVTITVGGSAEGNVGLVNGLDKGLGIGEVGVGVAAVEVGAGHTVLNSASEAELSFEDGLSVGASDTVESIKQDLEVGVGGEELLDEIEVEDVLKHVDIVGGAVDDLNLKGAVGLSAEGRNINIGDVGNLVRGQGLGSLVDLIGNGLGGRATVGEVVLDAEIVLGAC